MNIQIKKEFAMVIDEINAHTNKSGLLVFTAIVRVYAVDGWLFLLPYRSLIVLIMFLEYVLLLVKQQMRNANEESD